MMGGVIGGVGYDLATRDLGARVNAECVDCFLIPLFVLFFIVIVFGAGKKE